MKSNSPPPRRWLTVKNACIYSDLSRANIEKRLADGTIRSALVIGEPGATRGRRLVDRESLDSWIESGIGLTATSPPPPGTPGHPVAP